MNEATATIIVKLYANAGIFSIKPNSPNAKQIHAMQELNFCCPISSGMYKLISFVKNNLAKRIIGLNPVKMPSKLATNGIANSQYCPVSHVKTTALNIVHWLTRTNGRGIEIGFTV